MNDIKIGLGDNSSWSIFVPPEPEKPPSIPIEIPEKVEFKQTTIDSGFSCDDTLVVDCPKPELHTHLFKENYLGEFKAESEKELARNNLGVYSKDEVNKVLVDAVENLDTSIFITKKEVYNLVENLDFVNSSIKANIDYEIPEQLFSL